MWSDKVEPETERTVKIFGRDPLLWTALVSAVLTGLAAFKLGLDPGAAGAINGVVVVAVAIWATRPVTPGLFTGLVTAAVSLLAEYGIHLEEVQTTALHSVVLTAFALITRQQVKPRDTAISRS